VICPIVVGIPLRLCGDIRPPRHGPGDEPGDGLSHLRCPPALPTGRAEGAVSPVQRAARAARERVELYLRPECAMSQRVKAILIYSFSARTPFSCIGPSHARESDESRRAVDLPAPIMPLMVGARARGCSVQWGSSAEPAGPLSPGPGSCPVRLLLLQPVHVPGDVRDGFVELLKLREIDEGV